MENIEAKELTIRQIQEVLKGLEEGKTHDADLLFPDEPIPFHAVSLSAGIAIEKLEEEWTPSRLKGLIEEVRKANPFFSDMIKKFAEIGVAALAAKDLTEPSAD
ncbi:MAG: hypothetical protein PVG49_16035 [Desulfobacteraceae bacterium]|jgi:hypothetical protein